MNNITKKYLLLSLFFILCLAAFHASAQEPVTISGYVYDEQQEPLAGAVVRNAADSAGKQAAITDGKGFFTLAAITRSPQSSFIVSFTGYENLVFAYTPGVSGTPLKLSLVKSNTSLEQVMVSAGRYEQDVKRLSVSTEVIKPYLVENKVTTNMQYFMDQVPSVSVVDGQANIRGGSGWTYGAGSRVLVMLDDMPLMTGDAGQVQWKFLPVDNLEQIEVIKGASSVLYGSSALNGIINIRTAAPGSKPATTVSTFLTIYDQPPRDSLKWSGTTRFQQGVNVVHTQKIKQLDLTLGLNYLNDDGYRLGEDDQRTRFSFSTNYHSPKHKGLSYGINGSVMGQSSSAFLLWENFSSGYTALDSQKTTTKAFNLNLDPHLDFKAFGITHRIRMRYFKVVNDVSAPDPNVDQDNRSWQTYGEYQLQKYISATATRITAGTMAIYTESNSPLFSGTQQSNNLAFFMQVDQRIRRFNFTAGARGERFSINSEKQSQPIARAGVNYELTSSTFLRSSYGQGFRFPSIAEKYITTSVGAINIFPNPGVTAEKGWSAEAGVRQLFKIAAWKGYVDAAYFRTEYENMVEFNFGQWAPFDFNNPPASSLSLIGFKAVNVGRTRISGIDLSAGGQGRIGKCTIALVAGYTYCDPVSLEPDKIFAVDAGNTPLSYKNTSTDTTGNVLKYRYRHLAKGDLQVSYRIFSSGVSVRYSSFMENIDQTFTSVIDKFVTTGPGVESARMINRNGDWIFDYRASVKILKKLNVNFVINNVFNHLMMTRPADLRPPRTFTLQLTLKM